MREALRSGYCASFPSTTSTAPLQTSPLILARVTSPHGVRGFSVFAGREGRGAIVGHHLPPLAKYCMPPDTGTNLFNLFCRQRWLKLKKEARKKMTKQEKLEDDLRETFDMYDIDGSGAIDLSELRLMTNELCIPMTEDELTEVQALATCICTQVHESCYCCCCCCCCSPACLHPFPLPSTPPSPSKAFRTKTGSLGLRELPPSPSQLSSAAM